MLVRYEPLYKLLLSSGSGDTAGGSKMPLENRKAGDWDVLFALLLRSGSAVSYTHLTLPTN